MFVDKCHMLIHCATGVSRPYLLVSIRLGMKEQPYGWPQLRNPNRQQTCSPFTSCPWMLESQEYDTVRSGSSEPFNIFMKLDIVACS